MSEMTNSDTDRRAEDAFRRGLHAYADTMPVPDLAEGLAAIVGTPHVADAGTPIAARSDPSRPETALRPSGPGARPPRTSHRRRWIAAALVVVVVIGVGVPLTVRALQRDPGTVDAVPAQTLAPTTPNVSTSTPASPAMTAAAALKALLLTDKDMSKVTVSGFPGVAYKAGSLATTDQIATMGAAPDGVYCGYDARAVVAAYLAGHAQDRAGLPVATGTYVHQVASDSTEILWADPDKGILNALVDNLALCEKGYKVTTGPNAGVTQRWHALPAGWDMNSSSPSVEGLTYVEVMEDSLPGVDPGQPLWFAFGHVDGVTLVAKADIDYTGTSFFNAAYAKIGGGSSVAEAKVAVPCPKGPAVPGVVRSACQDSVSATRARELLEGTPIFITPSANIGCDMSRAAPDGSFDGEVRCDILEATFSAPPQPKGGCAAGDWVSGVTRLSGKGAAIAGACAGDPTVAFIALGNGEKPPVLAYGSSLVAGDFVCMSATDGLTCWNTATNHGFKLSKSTRLVW